MLQLVCTTKEFFFVRYLLRKAHLRALMKVLTSLQLVISNLSGRKLTFYGVWHFGEVSFSHMSPSFHCTCQKADSVYSVVCLNGSLMSVL